MRVLMLAAVPFFSERGMGLAIAERIRAICQSGRRVDLLALPGGRDPAPPIAGLTIIRLPSFGRGALPIGPSIRKLLYLPLLVAATAGRLLFGRPGYDCIYAHGETSWPAWPLAMIFAKPLLYDVHFAPADELAARPRWRNRLLIRLAEGLERTALRRADVVVTISEELAEQARRWRRGRPTRVIENRPIEGMFALANYSPPVEPLVVYTGNLGPFQGIELLLAAASLVCRRRPDARFEIIGGDEEEIASARRIARAVGVQANVTFAGPLPVGETAERIARAAVLVSPRIGGQSPLKVYSYLASGRPIVATDVPAHRPLLNPGVARLAEPEPQSLADAILDLLDHPDQAAALAGAARRYALERFTWVGYCAKIEQALAVTATAKG